MNKNETILCARAIPLPFRPRLPALLVIVAALFLAAGFASAQTYTGYILSYFGGQPYTQTVHMAFSSDGLHWTPLNRNFGIVAANTGTTRARDPFFLRKQNGGWVVLATQGWDTNSIYVWDSPDLVTFGNPRMANLNNFGVRTWAPQAIWNPTANNYIVYWSGNVNGGPNRTYYNTTTDFVTFSPPNLYFDPGIDQIDADIRPWNGWNYLFYKSEATRGILIARSSTLNAGSFAVQRSTSVTPTGVEGPAVFKSNTQNRWYMYYDILDAGGVFGLSTSTDISNPNGWTGVPAANFSLPVGVRHAYVQPVTTAELNAIRAKWENPSYVWWETSNFAGRFIRHKDGRGRIDSTVIPLEDAEWKMVPGLANASAVSFESVNVPGQYLRHKNGEIFREANNGSALFPADATFYKRAGLSDGAGVSFESYNYPGRYIRHRNSLLYNETITTDTARKDATFFSR